MSFFENEMTRLGLKQDEITRVCKITRQTVTNWAKGATAIPSDKLALLADIGFDVQYVVTGVRGNLSPSGQSVDKVTKEQLIDSLVVALNDSKEQTRTLETAIEILRNLG